MACPLLLLLCRRGDMLLLNLLPSEHGFNAVAQSGRFPMQWLLRWPRKNSYLWSRGRLEPAGPAGPGLFLWDAADASPLENPSVPAPEAACRWPCPGGQERGDLDCPMPVDCRVRKHSQVHLATQYGSKSIQSTASSSSEGRLPKGTDL